MAVRLRIDSLRFQFLLKTTEQQYILYLHQKDSNHPHNALHNSLLLQLRDVCTIVNAFRK